MQRRTLLKALAAGGLLPVAGVAAAAVPFRDVLETPAQKSPLAARGLVSGLTRAGKRLVAVGQRGHVLLSDDAGKTWQQADVPVSADLVAVCFPNEQTGWAVGHDGVILKSVDAGRSWSRQLDGRGLGDVLVPWYTKSGDSKWLAEAPRRARRTRSSTSGSTTTATASSSAPSA